MSRLRKLVAAAAIAAFTGILFGPPAQAEVGKMPPTHETGAYVTEIDTDWVIVSVSQSNRKDSETIEVWERRLLGVSEVWDLAEFACKLYDRTSVLLSQSRTTLSSGFLSRINYFFACAIP